MQIAGQRAGRGNMGSDDHHVEIPVIGLIFQFDRFLVSLNFFHQMLLMMISGNC
jgi:hypothetical protein